MVAQQKPSELQQIMGDGDLIVVAAKNNEVDKVVAILRSTPGASNFGSGPSNITALMAAASRGHLKTVQVILDDIHTDVQLTDSFSRTALEHSYPFPEVTSVITQALFADVDLHNDKPKPV